MIDFSIKTEDLKKALSLTFLSVSSTKDTIESHSTLNVIGEVLEITSTDKSSRLSKAVIDITNKGDANGIFTADPGKILNLLKMSSLDDIRITYDKSSTTVSVYTSEDTDSFISLPSFEIIDPIPDIFEKAFEIKVVNADIFLKGLKFAYGFINAKDNKYGNVYLSKGAFYGSNGNNQIGAWSSAELDGIDDMVFPGAIMPFINNLITKLNFIDMSIRSTSNIIVLCSSDSRFNFGFTKIQVPMPKMPINIKEPDLDSWLIEKKPLLKKMGRLKLAGDKIGIKAVLTDTTLEMITATERASKESMPCKRLKGTEETKITFDCRLIENALNLFDDDFKIYVGKHLNIYSTGNCEIESGSGPIAKPFTATAVVGLARE